MKCSRDLFWPTKSFADSHPAVKNAGKRVIHKPSGGLGQRPSSSQSSMVTLLAALSPRAARGNFSLFCRYVLIKKPDSWRRSLGFSIKRRAAAVKENRPRVRRARNPAQRDEVGRGV